MIKKALFTALAVCSVCGGAFALSPLGTERAGLMQKGELRIMPAFAYKYENSETEYGSLNELRFGAFTNLEFQIEKNIVLHSPGNIYEHFEVAGTILGGKTVVARETAGRPMLSVMPFYRVNDTHNINNPLPNGAGLAQDYVYGRAPGYGVELFAEKQITGAVVYANADLEVSPDRPCYTMSVAADMPTLIEKLSFIPELYGQFAGDKIPRIKSELGIWYLLAPGVELGLDYDINLTALRLGQAFTTGFSIRHVF